MPNRKVIAIVGATGFQGGSLIRAILNEGDKCEFVPRAITRDASSEKALALKKLGVEVVQADVNNEAALEKALEGAHGMYCVTFYWQNFSPEKEMAQARSMANAARKAGIKHIIWSTLENSRKIIDLEHTTIPTLMDKYKVPHFDAKGESDELFANLPTTYMLVSFYWENLIFAGMGPTKRSDGKYNLTIPMEDKRLAGIGVDDIGKCALAILKRPDEYINKRVPIAGELLTIPQMVDKLSKALGKEVLHNDVSFDAYSKLGFPGAEDLANMFHFLHDYETKCCSDRYVEECRKLNSEMMTFDQWLAAKKHLITVD